MDGVDEMDLKPPKAAVLGRGWNASLPSSASGSLGEGLQIGDSTGSRLLFGVASAFAKLRRDEPSDHEVLFVIMGVIY